MNLNLDWTPQCRAVCRRAKYIGESIYWSERGNHEGSLGARGAILDAQKVTIPGLEFLGELQHRRYGPYQKYSIVFRKEGQVFRVMMLEVCPPHIRSHLGPEGALMGPHIHLGDERARGPSQFVRRLKLNLDHHSVQRWIDRFQRHANVANDGDNRLESPFRDDLFGLL